MAQGRIACELEGPHFDQERIMKFATMGASAAELEASAHEVSELEVSARDSSRAANDDHASRDRP
jgi:hypothetical protein